MSTENHALTLLGALENTFRKIEGNVDYVGLRQLVAELSSLTDKEYQLACETAKDVEGCEFVRTERGFAYAEFPDRYGQFCVLQKSSLADEDAIWFGTRDANPQILATQARQAGVETDQTTGWVNFPIPDGVHLSTRMHLTQKMVMQLIPTLFYFAVTGELPLNEEAINEEDAGNTSAKWNHAFDFAFEVRSPHEDGSKVEAKDVRKALQDRLDSLSDTDLLAASNCFDSHNEAG